VVNFHELGNESKMIEQIKSAELTTRQQKIADELAQLQRDRQALAAQQLADEKSNSEHTKREIQEYQLRLEFELENKLKELREGVASKLKAEQDQVEGDQEELRQQRAKYEEELKKEALEIDAAVRDLKILQQALAQETRTEEGQIVINLKHMTQKIQAEITDLEQIITQCEKNIKDAEASMAAGGAGATAANGVRVRLPPPEDDSTTRGNLLPGPDSPPAARRVQLPPPDSMV
jgi:hypothetical protein